MSLFLKFDRVYLDLDVKKTTFQFPDDASSGGQAQTLRASSTPELPASPGVVNRNHFRPVNCTCKVRILRGNRLIKLGKVYLDDYHRKLYHTHVETREMMSKKRKSASSNANAVTDSNRHFMDMVKNDQDPQNRAASSKKKSINFFERAIVYHIEGSLQDGDKLMMEFFHQSRLKNRSFGKFEMLLDFLKENLNNSIKTNLNINEYLVDSKTNLISKYKVVFTLDFMSFYKFNTIVEDISSILQDHDPHSDFDHELALSLHRSSSVDLLKKYYPKRFNDCTRHDFIQLIKLTGEFAFTYFFLKGTSMSR